MKDLNGLIKYVKVIFNYAVYDITIVYEVMLMPLCSFCYLQIKVDDDGNIIDAKFKTFGCGSAIASSSLATEWVKGKNVNSQ